MEDSNVPAWKAMLVLTTYLPLVLPLLNLGLVFVQQITSGALCATASVLHIVGNPIDAFWSILCRQEAIHRSYLFATQHTPDIARELAAVLATYDWWLGDARQHVASALEERRQKQGGHDRNAPLVTENEKRLLRRAALRLRATRNANSAHMSISVLSYCLALLLMAWRVLHWDSNHMKVEAGRILSFAALFSHLLFAIRLNDGVGGFVFHDEASRIVFDLCRDLESISQGPTPRTTFLPWPLLQDGYGGTLITHVGSSAFSRQYDELGFVSGIVNCVRARKLKSGSNAHDRSNFMLAFISICATFVSALGSGCIALSSPMLKDSAGLLSITGCASLWVLNWLLSLALSLLITHEKIRIATYRWILLVTDIFFTIGIVGCFGWSFMADVTTAADAATDLAGFKAASHLTVWLLSMFLQVAFFFTLAAWASFERADSSKIFVRSFAEALADHSAL